MATITTATPASSQTCSLVLRKGSIGVSSSPVIAGLPSMARRGGRVMCSAEKPSKKGASAGMSSASLMAAATIASPALALVDERMSTEGTGLVFGLSNNLLGWILLGVFGLIWTLYFTYTSTLEEDDDDSGLSL